MDAGDRLVHNAGELVEAGGDAGLRLVKDAGRERQGGGFGSRPYHSARNLIVDAGATSIPRVPVPARRVVLLR